MTETILSLTGLILTGAGLLYAGYELRQSRNIACGEFLLHIDELLQQHNKIHALLRPGGDYYTKKSRPMSREDWIAVESYMGLFERIKILLDRNIIDLDTVEKFYGYRVDNIVRNDTIRHVKLELAADGWQDFNKLRQALERHRKKGRVRRLVERLLTIIR